mgnify:CR=1 FL=1
MAHFQLAKKRAFCIKASSNRKKEINAHVRGHSIGHANCLVRENGKKAYLGLDDVIATVMDHKKPPPGYEVYLVYCPNGLDEKDSWVVVCYGEY